MKSFLSVSTFSFIVLFILQSATSSCTKENTIYDTLTVIKRDTIIIKDTAISLQLLTANSWKVEELRGVQGNNEIVYYKRGATGNTENFDPEYITFNSNKTGVYYDAFRTTHQITWDFLNADNTKLTFTILKTAPETNHTVTYENLRYKNGALLFDQYWTYKGVNSHAQAVRTRR